MGTVVSYLKNLVTPAGPATLLQLLADASDDSIRKNLKEAYASGYQKCMEEEIKKKGSTASEMMSVISSAIMLGLLLSIMVGIIFDEEVEFNWRFWTWFKRKRYGEVTDDVEVRFSDVKAMDETKAEVKQFVEYLKDPEKFTRLGARLPKGILLVGPPGTGKTLLARAVAGEAGVPFFRASGSQFEEMFVGLGARRVRKLFKAARSCSPCVVFIDEIDSVGGRRMSNVSQHYNQVINQLLTELDGFEKMVGVIVMAATNSKDALDPALLRPGRFDLEIHVANPDLKGREDIFKLYLSKIKAEPRLETDLLARRTVGFSGADIENMVNQAALKATADDKDEVTMHYLEIARQHVTAGPAKSRIPDEKTNTVTAYHEAGHALVAYFTAGAKPIDRITIIPRGRSLGHTSFIPDGEEYHQTKFELLAMIDTLMGGRAAEELHFGIMHITMGAADDLKKATEIASAMVKQGGMFEESGLRTYEDREIDGVKFNDRGPETNQKIDSQIEKLLQESYKRAKTILESHTGAHKRLAEVLLVKETLDLKEMKSIVGDSGEDGREKMKQSFF